MSRVELLVLRVGDEQVMEEWGRSTISAGLAQRARLLVLASEGTHNAQVARLVGVSLPTVAAWRNRYASRGLAALADLPRFGSAVGARRAGDYRRHAGHAAGQAGGDALVLAVAR